MADLSQCAPDLRLKDDDQDQYSHGGDVFDQPLHPLQLKPESEKGDQKEQKKTDYDLHRPGPLHQQEDPVEQESHDDHIDQIQEVKLQKAYMKQLHDQTKSLEMNFECELPHLGIDLENPVHQVSYPFAFLNIVHSDYVCPVHYADRQSGQASLQSLLDRQVEDFADERFS